MDRSRCSARLRIHNFEFCRDLRLCIGVRINTVAPGLTATELAITANPGAIDDIVAKTPMGRIGQPDEIAASV
eukprot:COSAG01_NODE_40015_length_468_cov_27.577236_2_plen_72_part_01